MNGRPGPWGAPAPSDVVFLCAALIIALAITGIGWLVTGGPAQKLDSSRWSATRQSFGRSEAAVAGS